MADELRLFVREALGRGIARPAIHEQLRSAGWREDEIRSALASFAESVFPVPVPRRKPYQSARETFLYLVMFATLYVSAFNLGQLLFRFVDRANPDPVRAGQDAFVLDQIRGATAALIIAFPIFFVLARHLARAVARDPDKRGSRVRKWLTYLTLFLAAGTLIGDLIALVSGMLQGNLTSSFFLKVAAVLFISGSIFGYYLVSLRGEEE